MIVINEDWLYQKYAIEHLSVHKIALLLGYCDKTIEKWLNKYKIDHSSFTPEQWFWTYITKLDEDKCWPWSGGLTASGYGKFWYNKKIWLSHRLVYYFTYGKIDDSMFVCHRCDNPMCCNPKHLFLGSAKDNTNDMINKGRQQDYSKVVRGSDNLMSKVTEQQVKEILFLHQEGKCKKKEIANKYGLTLSGLESIIYRRCWKHISL